MLDAGGVNATIMGHLAQFQKSPIGLYLGITTGTRAVQNRAHFLTHCPDGPWTKLPGLVLSIAVLPASNSTAASFVALRRAISSYIWRRFWLTSLTKAWTSADAPSCTMP